MVQRLPAGLSLDEARLELPLHLSQLWNYAAQGFVLAFGRECRAMGKG